MDKSTKSIVCDHCDKELIAYTSYPAKYSLELKTVNTNINNTGTEFAVMMYPQIKETMHFCGLGCLGFWSSGVQDG